MNIQLTISMLVSDRMETLGKCLASLKPLLRELDSELIVVFTGKNEETLELVRQYTSHIIPFEWCNDFSKARNAGLKEGRGEWFLYLDDDEWFDDTTEIIRVFERGEYKNYRSACYVARNYLDLEGKSYSDGDVGRMCRLTPETQFIYSIHENLNTFEEPCKRLSAFVHHYGYAKKETFAWKETRTSRNLPLLLEMYEKEPDSPWCCMQIAQEYRSVGEFEQAVEYCRKGLEFARKEVRISNYELWLQVNLPLLISFTGDLRLALEEGEQILRHPRTLEAGIMHICVILTSLCRQLRECDKGLKYIQLYREKLLYLMKHPEKAMLQRSAGLTLDKGKEEMAPMYLDGLSFALDIKDFRMARKLLSWLPWEDKAQMTPYYSHMEEWKRVYEDQKDEILQAFDSLDTTNSYVCIQKALFAEKQGQIEKAEVLWKTCASDCPAGFQWELMEIAVRNHFQVEPLLEQMSPEIWNGYAEMVAERKELGQLQEFCQNIMPLLEKRPFYRRKLEQSYLEKLLTTELLDSSRLVKLLNQYCTSVCTDATALYREEVLADPEAYALPTRYRFAVPLGKALRLIDNGEFIESFPYLKEALHVYPGMAGAVGQLVRYLEDEVQAPKRSVSEEFEMLGGQVKQVLRGLMKAGQWEEAYKVMGQLITLLPDDLEVLQMKQEILRLGV